MTLALHSFLGTLVAYCEINQHACAVLQRNMDKKLLPTAPIVHDVRDITKGSMDIDAITASWPCVGHSSMGLKQGLDNIESTLFHEVMRLCDEFPIKFLFLENVRAMLTNGGLKVIQLLASRGFSMHYAVIPASAVGSPQHRHRWFCIATRLGYTFSTELPLGRKFRWDQDEGGVARMIQAGKEERKKAFKRCEILGNALVPDQIRLAFIFLVTGQAQAFSEEDITLPGGETWVSDAKGQDLSDIGGLLPAHAYVKNGLLYKLPLPTFLKPNLSLELRADNYTSTTPLNKAISSELLQTHKLCSWSTPRKTMTGACNVLTRRSARDLPTCLRHEKGTPKEMATGIMSPNWVEWLMGFPQGWTDF